MKTPYAVKVCVEEINKVRQRNGAEPYQISKVIPVDDWWHYVVLKEEDRRYTCIRVTPSGRWFSPKNEPIGGFSRMKDAVNGIYWMEWS